MWILTQNKKRIKRLINFITNLWSLTAKRYWFSTAIATEWGTKNLYKLYFSKIFPSRLKKTTLSSFFKAKISLTFRFLNHNPIKKKASLTFSSKNLKITKKRWIWKKANFLGDNFWFSNQIEPFPSRD